MVPGTKSRLKVVREFITLPTQKARNLQVVYDKVTEGTVQNQLIIKRMIAVVGTI